MSEVNNEFPQYVTLIDTIIGPAGTVMTFNPISEMYENITEAEDTDGVNSKYEGSSVAVDYSVIEEGYGVIFGVLEVEVDDEKSDCAIDDEEYTLYKRVDDLEYEVIKLLLKVNGRERSKLVPTDNDLEDDAKPKRKTKKSK